MIDNGTVPNPMKTNRTQRADNARERAAARRAEREAIERAQAEADAAAGCRCPLCNGRNDDPAGIHGRR